MAVTIIKTPVNYTPSDNPLMYEFSSTNTGQANFSFIVETYLDAVKVGEDRVYLENGIKSHIDVSETVSSLMQSPVHEPTPATFSAEVDVKSVNIKVYESWGSPAIIHAGATSASSKTWKARVSDETFLTIDFDTDWNGKKWLTNHPTKNIDIPFGKDVFLSEIIDGEGDLYVGIYDSNGLQDTFEDTFNVDIVKVNLNSDSFIVAEPTVTKIVAKFGLTGEEFTINYVNQECAQELNVLYWLNEYGVTDQFLFKHSAIKAGNVEAQGYSKQFGGWSGGSFVYSNNTGDRNNQTKRTNKIDLNSDYISEAEQNWFNECFSSPRHILNNWNYKLTSASFTDEQDRFQDLISVSVSLQYSSITKSMNV